MRPATWPALASESSSCWRWVWSFGAGSDDDSSRVQRPPPEAMRTHGGVYGTNLLRGGDGPQASLDGAGWSSSRRCQRRRPSGRRARHRPHVTGRRGIAAVLGWSPEGRHRSARTGLRLGRRRPERGTRGERRRSLHARCRRGCTDAGGTPRPVALPHLPRETEPFVAIDVLAGIGAGGRPWTAVRGRAVCSDAGSRRTPRSLPSGRGCRRETEETLPRPSHEAGPGRPPSGGAKRFPAGSLPPRAIVGVDEGARGAGGAQRAR
jgi:hypothetical protein